jgi:uncharacterized membrane protein
MTLNLGPLHPIHVHFAIALLVAGVAFRVAWLCGQFLLKGRLAFAGPAACALIVAGTLAVAAAVQSGQAASGDAEAIPGAHDAVEEHEHWAEWTYRLFVMVSLLEIAGLVLKRFDKAGPVLALSGLAGLAGLFLVYETAEHGGKVVYSHAGGVGTRSGQPRDVSRLFLAGLYQQSRLDRREGRPEDAARLVDLLAARFPEDLEIQLLRAESQLEDRKDAAATTAILSRMVVPKEDRSLRRRHGLLLVDALVAAGQVDAAKAALQHARSEFPDDGGVAERMRRLEAAPPATVPPPTVPPDPASPPPSPVP